MLRQIWLVILLGVLTACSASNTLPNNQLVEKAIARYLNLTQPQISQQLDLDIRGFKIDGLAITQQEPLVIHDLPAYHIWGTYNLTLNQSKRQITQSQNPFELYLQRQQEGKTWRLLIPEERGWASYQLTIDN